MLLRDPGNWSEEAFAQAQQSLLASGRCSIHNALDPELAELALAAIIAHPDWKRTYLFEDKIYNVPKNSAQSGQITILDKLLTEKPSDSFRFRYSKIEGNQKDDRSDPSAFGEVRRILSDLNTIKTIEKLTGRSELTSSGIKASHFEPGDYLSQHTDGKREVAFVLGLSKDWQSDWGGHLHFPGKDGSVAGMVPGFNRLDLFLVPRLHSVSVVTAAAQSARIAISGWWLRQPKQDASET